MTRLPETKSGQPVRGVNFGGWLVLEKWMKPSLFSGMRAKDETSWCVELGRKALDAAGNVRDAEENLAAELRELDGNVLPTVVGEWSLGTGGQRTDAERRAFFHAQIKAFEDCHGAFFRSYKIESGNPDWSLRDAVERGLEL